MSEAQDEESDHQTSCAGTQNLYVYNNYPGMTGTNNYEPINPGYRLAQTGKTFPSNNIATPTAVTEKDCLEICRNTDGCKGWGFYWAADLSDSGTCILKSQIDVGPADETRAAFVARWKGGQMMHVDKGSLCPGGHLHIHTYVDKERASDQASYTSQS